MCPFKESTMRLRYSVPSLDYYSLWKTHELDDVDLAATCHWPGSGQLVEKAVFLVPDNMPAGKVSQALPALLASLSGAKRGITKQVEITDEQRTSNMCAKPCISAWGHA